MVQLFLLPACLCVMGLCDRAEEMTSLDDDGEVTSWSWHPLLPLLLIYYATTVLATERTKHELKSFHAMPNA